MYNFLFAFHCNYVYLAPFPRYYRQFLKIYTRYMTVSSQFVIPMLNHHMV